MTSKEKKLSIALLTEKLQNITGKKVIFEESENSKIKITSTEAEQLYNSGKDIIVKKRTAFGPEYLISKSKLENQFKGAKEYHSDDQMEPSEISNPQVPFAMVLKNYTQTMGAFDFYKPTETNSKIVKENDEVFQNNDPEYTCYIIQNRQDGTIKIVDGYEYPEDAKERVKEMASEQEVKKDPTLRIFTTKGCKKLNLDPNNNSDWANYEWYEIGTNQKSVQENDEYDNMYNLVVEDSEVFGEEVKDVVESIIKEVDDEENNDEEDFEIGDQVKISVYTSGVTEYNGQIGEIIDIDHDHGIADPEATVRFSDGKTGVFSLDTLSRVTSEEDEEDENIIEAEDMDDDPFDGDEEAAERYFDAHSSDNFKDDNDFGDDDEANERYFDAHYH
jgi:hypothetical protein